MHVCVLNLMHYCTSMLTLSFTEFTSMTYYSLAINGEENSGPEENLLQNEEKDDHV